MFSADFLNENGVLATWLASTSFILLRFVLFAGAAFFIFYKICVTELLKRKIQPRFPTSKQLKQELLNSAVSSVIFGLFTVFVIVLKVQGHTLIYNDILKYGYGYLIFSLIAMIFLHDAYFYWMHRLLHQPKWFKQIHFVHHYSHNPSPWASFSFHPLEAILEFAILPIAVFIMPLHPLVLFAWSMWMISWNVIGHLGYEIFPKRFSSSVWFNWLNTSTHHNLHHAHSKGNFGLYFNFWDRWMGTNDCSYRKTFDEVVEQHNIPTRKFFASAIRKGRS
ncbi:MAG: sterol desaturase family protein [Bacteroidetes bacterium]|nr:sterol desaturase family protein [Bacteroidota bacterium]